MLHYFGDRWASSGMARDGTRRDALLHQRAWLVSDPAVIDQVKLPELQKRRLPPALRRLLGEGPLTSEGISQRQGG